MDSRLYWIWLQQALGVGSPKADPLLRVLETPAAVWRAEDQTLKELGMTKNERERLAQKSLDSAAGVLEASQKDGGWVLTPDDALYPDNLRGIYALPLVLYGKGELPEWDSRPGLGMVGPREPTVYGRQMARYLSQSVAAAGITVISGGAVGIDAVCHEGAIDAGGITIAVQGCGLDVDYPRRNAALRQRILKAGGAVLTEYPPQSPPLGEHFPVRNRIISGLAQGVCVVEAPVSSGSLITATCAREQGREVMTLPGPAGMASCAGSNALLRKGASLVENAGDILLLYQDRFGSKLDTQAAGRFSPPVWQPLQPAHRESSPAPAQPVQVPPAGERRPRQAEPKKCPAGLSPDAQRMYERLEDEPRPVDWLARQAGMDTSRALTVLTELEIAGAARSFAGGRYGR